ncbi:class I SAM-dependent methyltransferase [Marinobacter halophilus]|uniref:Class I SAM-dependent methyltransferase n=1 Tax=Marinobacter halophilus TaxID=1323740 RepID=A0A2T1K9C1_9GAMM|nr:methyltransferase [Marinobacter halophilus]PSF06725.1 class I SAM-dependent methyltransferase [Marinobacter halophilus]
MTSALLEFDSGELTLFRPGAVGDSLRAWDAADELLLGEAQLRLGRASGRVLVVDDHFGALTLGLADYAPRSVADSAVLAVALKANAALNPDIPEPAPPLTWLTPPDGPFDLVVMRIPRQAEYLGWLLRWVNGVLADEGCLLAGGMIKHLPDRSVGVFAGAVTTETVLPARKKARVVVCRRGEAQLADWPGTWKGYSVPGVPAPVKALPAVFARDRLDIGTRELLPLIAPAVAQVPGGTRVLDLACGNGILGLLALAERDDIEVDFSDVSSQSVASVRRNLAQCRWEHRATTVHSDGIDGGAGQYQLILLNPPFHEGGVVGDHIALRLFQEAARHLAPQGRVLIVGNRHLGYHRTLQRFFARISQQAASPRFVIFEASL